MSGHTPGPWSVAPRIGRYQVIPATEDERRKLASINALEFEELSVGTPNGQMVMIPLDESNLANARLIAAAPDLLKALEAVTKMAIAGDEYSYADWGKDYVEDARVTNAKAAIAKARGEA